MRLGAWACKLEPDSLAARGLRSRPRSAERHRHRYEFNREYRGPSSPAAGLRISGGTPDATYVEIVELPDHPFFLGCRQFHPEFKSKPLEPHIPLFVSVREGLVREQAETAARSTMKGHVEMFHRRRRLSTNAIKL